MKWTREAEAYMKEQQKQLSARNRVKQRKAVNKNLARRERQATLNAQLKKFLNYALRRGHKEPRQLALHVRTGETTTIIDTKPAFHATEMKHTATHMGTGRRTWYLNTSGDMLPEFRDTKHGKEWRRNEKSVQIVPTRQPPRFPGGTAPLYP